ncbi:MarR family winged helix-turn-helix transcriptional regulator [Cumulibacter manganitolerans]|uniref:MarR family winged helix-turn-helix transcriptional regulator n=1 Tax=Cumulibacter manganitolerans TaxID=1884992 RepID=UPI001E37FE15|nr:MarR family winged helix-turn-helix transcriptional regulator [Cumulibacter manganitolerans]
MPPPPSDVATLTEVITRLRRALRRSIRTEYSWESLPMAQVELMQHLDEHRATRVGDLADLMLLAPNTVSSLVEQAVSAGRAERTKHPEDKRVALVQLTSQGQQQLRQWMSAHERRLTDALEHLPSKDRAAILRAVGPLERLVAVLNER